MQPHGTRSLIDGRQIQGRWKTIKRQDFLLEISCLFFCLFEQHRGQR